MSNAFSLRCIYLSCKVLYFILSDDDFEIKSKIYSFNLRLVLKHILHSQDVFFRRVRVRVSCFLLYFFKLSAGHGFFDIHIRVHIIIILCIHDRAKGLKENRYSFILYLIIIIIYSEIR